MVEVVGDEPERFKDGHLLWFAFCAAIALLLIAAAGLKAWNAPVILAKDGLLANKSVLLAAVGLEMAVAILILALRDRTAWWLIIGLFSMFLVAASYSLISQTECNCFGFDWLGAWFTLPIDACVVAIAFLLRSKVYAPPVFGSQLLTTLALAVVSALTGVSIAEYRNWWSTNTEKLEYLIADDMLGKPWPITEVYHPNLVQLQTGKWLVLILRPDCDHCRELVDKHFEDPSWHRPGERTAIFLAGSDEWSFRFDHVSMVPGDAKLVWKAGEPFVASPFLVQLSDGVVDEAGDRVWLD